MREAVETLGAVAVKYVNHGPLLGLISPRAPSCGSYYGVLIVTHSRCVADHGGLLWLCHPVVEKGGESCLEP
jgi:hypothetical protein